MLVEDANSLTSPEELHAMANITHRKWYIRIYIMHCVLDSSIARKYMRAVDEKQDINLLWP